VSLWARLEETGTFVPVARGLPSSGEHLRNVPDSHNPYRVRLRAVAFDRSRNWAEDLSDTAISIVSVVDAPKPPRPEFDLRILGGGTAGAPIAIEAGLDAPGEARLEIYDVAGRRVRALLQRKLPAGTHRSAWDLRTDRHDRVPSGIYLVRWLAGRRSLTRRVVVLH
jgi:hypothetical protein